MTTMLNYAGHRQKRSTTCGAIALSASIEIVGAQTYPPRPVWYPAAMSR